MSNKRRKPTTLPIGSISHGTMRPEDLIPTFLSEAESLRLSKAERATVREIAKRHNADDYDYDSEEAGYDLEELFDLLSNHVPDYCYFGSHPGDWADYGVWISEDIADSDVARVNDPAELHAVKDNVALFVNDHGNMTLYRRADNRWIEVWSVV